MASVAAPLAVAVDNGRLDCVVELLRGGADQNVGDEPRTSSPIQLAVLNDEVSCIRLLLEQSRGPVDVDDLLGLSIVSGAGCDVVEALVRSGRCDVERGGSDTPCRPLMMAALRGRSDVVDLLLDCNVEFDAGLIDEQDGQRLTALGFAVSAAVDPHGRADYWRRYVLSYTAPCFRVVWYMYAITMDTAEKLETDC